MQINIQNIIHQYNQAKEQLKAQYPDLEEDDEAFIDSLEGLTDLDSFMSKLVIKINELESHAEGLKALEATYSSRRKRMLSSAEKLEELAYKVMTDVGKTRLALPEATFSIARTPRKVIITNPEEIPDEFQRITKEPNKTAIKQALENGKQVIGAILSNGGSTLKINRK